MRGGGWTADKRAIGQTALVLVLVKVPGSSAYVPCRALVMGVITGWVHAAAQLRIHYIFLRLALHPTSAELRKAGLLILLLMCSLLHCPKKSGGAVSLPAASPCFL